MSANTILPGVFLGVFAAGGCASGGSNDSRNPDARVQTADAAAQSPDATQTPDAARPDAASIDASPADAAIAPDAEVTPPDADSSAPRPPVAGEVIITEFIAAPDNANREWVELYNPTDLELILDNAVFKDNDGDMATIGTLRLKPRQYVVIGDKAILGQDLTIDVRWSPGFNLDDVGGDEIIFEVAGMEIDRVEYTDSFPVSQATSTSLSIHKYTPEDNDKQDSWCSAIYDIRTGHADKGTPGVRNPACVIPSITRTANPEPDIAIDDMDGCDIEAMSTVTMDESCTIAGLAVDLGFSHTFPSDLIFKLKNAETTVTLVFKKGGTEPWNDALPRVPWRLERFSEMVVCDPDIPGGNCLETLIGTQAQGDWTLSVCDPDSIGDFAGTLNEWAIHFDCVQ